MKKNSLPYKSGFKVPENYFEELDSQLMELSPKSSSEFNKLKEIKSSGFKVHENYFENLEAQLLDLTTNSSAKPKALEAVGSSGFKTPEAYFENLEDELLAKLPKKKQGKLVQLFNKEILAYAAAIAAIVMALGGSLFLNNNPVTTWDNIELSILEDYIEENRIDFSTQEISSFLFQDGYVIDQTDFNSVSSEAVFEYLDDNMEDPDNIFE